MPIKHKVTDVVKNDVKFIITTKELLENRGHIQDIFAKELDKKSDLDSFNMQEMTKDIQKVLHEFQTQIWNTLKPSITEWCKLINTFFPISDPAIVNAYIYSESDTKTIPLGHQLKYLHDKSLREQYAFIDKIN